MNRYKYWTKKRLKVLQEQELFHDCLLPDIRNGKVFAALRGKQIHFYCHGRKLFGYSESGGFQTNVAFVVALKTKKKGEVKEKELTNLRLVDNFVEGYEQIKKNTGLYKEVESAEVSRLCNQFSFAKLPKKVKGQIVVLDVELSLESFDEDKSQDRIDLVLYHLESSSIRFFEVKLLNDSRLRAKTGQTPEVIAQLNRYNNQVATRKSELLGNYNDYVKKMSMLFDIELPPPIKIDPRVDLLLFGFKNHEMKKARSVVSQIHKNKMFCSYKGSVGASDISTTLRDKWWPRRH
jgi:hypothetical protein